jgi:hypothetical protein
MADQTHVSRDQAVALLTAILKKLFERTWMPWSPTLDRATARLVDLIIAAAVEAVQDDERAGFEAEIRELAAPRQPEPPPTRPRDAAQQDIYDVRRLLRPQELPR